MKEGQALVSEQYSIGILGQFKVSLMRSGGPFSTTSFCCFKCFKLLEELKTKRVVVKAISQVDRRMVRDVI